MNKIEKPKKICPYWSTTAHTCKIQNEGLFIPLGDHIEVYCKGSEYPLCKQFMLLEQAQANAIQGEQLKTNTDRRQYLRIKRSHRLTFIRLSDSGHPVCLQPSAANTLDLSIGGMRMNTRELLMHDSIIQFQFVPPFNSAIQEGLAKVKWCKPTEDNLIYQAGVSFQNDSLMQAVDEYLGSSA